MKDTVRFRRSIAALIVAGAVAGSTPSATAATFTVNPTQIFFSGRTLSSLLTIRNESDETLRFQLSAFAWSQSPSGEMQLEPTEDIVFFPSLLTLGPSEERRVRVGAVAPAGSQEKTYRIFVEEMPPLDRTAVSNGIRVLTKMGIPIFLRPGKAIAEGELTGLGRRDGNLVFTLLNKGTVHFVPESIRVRGLAGGTAVFEEQLNAWYVLAGDRRQFQFPLSTPACGKVTALQVEVRFGSATLEERLETPTGVCGS